MSRAITDIDLGAISKEIEKHENERIAVHRDNRIVASGPTYAETIAEVDDPDEVVVFKVPPLDVALAPANQ